MDRSGSENSTGQACTCRSTHGHAHAPTQCRAQVTADRARPAWWQRALAVATVAAGLMVGLNAMVQALNVLAAWWRHAG